MTNRPSQFRIAPVTEFTDEVSDILATSINRNGEVLNIFKVMAHHPKLMKRFNLLGGFILNKGLLPEREREIVILRVGANAVSKYEFGQHTVIGKQCGVTEAEILGLLRPADAHRWSDDDGALVAMADDLCADDCVSDAIFAKLRLRWTEAEVLELVMTAGFYRMVSGFLNSTGMELDEGVPDFPEPPSTGI
jgi:4-carboxymuconolactone decarboxylase